MYSGRLQIYNVVFSISRPMKCPMTAEAINLHAKRVYYKVQGTCKVTLTVVVVVVVVEDWNRSDPKQWKWQRNNIVHFIQQGKGANLWRDPVGNRDNCSPEKI